VLEGVVLGLGKHVQAEDCLEQRRVGECDDPFLVVAELEADCHLRTIERRARDVKARPAAISFRANQLTASGSCGHRGGIRRLLLLGLLPLALGTAPSASGDLPLLIGTDGPGFTIDLTDAGGNHVSVLTEGKYELLVHDLSDVHDFVLGSETQQTRVAATSVEGVGDQTFTIDLSRGRYVYACSAHWQTMFGAFVVVAAPPPPDTAKPLTARVSATAVSLNKKSVPPGTYRVTVVDRSTTRNFHLVGPGLNRRTSKPFMGTATWRLDLAAGTYRFGSDPTLSGRLVVRPD